MNKTSQRVFTGFRHSRADKAALVSHARKHGWSVSQLVESIVAERVREWKRDRQ